MPFSTLDVRDQKVALRKLAEMTRRGITSPRVVYTARAIVKQCPARNDECELTAIYEAVKRGDKSVAALDDGFRYVSDPTTSDFFAGPNKILEMCEGGACSGDCDEHTSLVAALCGSIGFQVGLVAWGKAGTSGYQHVYAIAGYPKRSPEEAVGMDTTVEQAQAGWEPPGGRRMYALINPSSWRKVFTR
jgi:hypothetical protein